MSKVALVAGNDTGVGKTHVSACLAKKLSGLGSVSFIKVVETGIVDDSNSDVVTLASLADNAVEKAMAIRSYSAPLAPRSAAALDSASLSLQELVEATRDSLHSQWTIVEGAGGLAVPLDATGGDWRDFAVQLAVDALVLVVEHRLGAINQTRLLDSYCQDLPMPYGFWLNEVSPQQEAVILSNEQELLDLGIPVWATQRHGMAPCLQELPWMMKTTK